MTNEEIKAMWVYAESSDCKPSGVNLMYPVISENEEFDDLCSRELTVLHEFYSGWHIKPYVSHDAEKMQGIANLVGNTLSLMMSNSKRVE